MRREYFNVIPKKSTIVANGIMYSVSILKLISYDKKSYEIYNFNTLAFLLLNNPGRFISSSFFLRPDASRVSFSYDTSDNVEDLYMNNRQFIMNRTIGLK